MLRFASSPTRDLSIDDLRLAIFNYIISKQRDEDLFIRIEDMDKERNIEGKDQEILDLLALFGIEYSHVVYQSENVRFHSAMALQLMHDKKAFSCFCSPEWLEKKREESRVAKKEYRYDDACRNLPAELVIDNMNPFTIRITGDDDTRGIDSFVIMNKDKVPTYNFASAIDDMLGNISLVIRNQDTNTSSALKQDHIRASLKYDKKVEYAHLAIIPNVDTLSVKSLLEDGFLPSAISNYLISIGNKPPHEIFEMQDAIEWFDINQVSKSPTPFDINALKHINKTHLLNLDAKELSRYVGFADEEIGELARIYLEEAHTTKELKEMISAIFAKKEIPEALKEQTKKMAEIIQSAPYFEEYLDFKNHIMHESGFKDEDFTKSFCILLTNVENGQDIEKKYKYLKNYIKGIIK